MLFYATSPRLTSIHSAIVQNYDDAKQRDLSPVLKVLAVSLFSWSHEQNLGSLWPTCIYDRLLSTCSSLPTLSIATLKSDTAEHGQNKFQKIICIMCWEE